MAKTISNRKKIQEVRIRQAESYLQRELEELSKIEVNQSTFSQITSKLERIQEYANELNIYYKEDAILIDIMLNDYELK